MAGGYCPSIVGIPKTVVTLEILNAHEEQLATRTLQRLLNSRAPNVVRRDIFIKDDPVWVFHRSSKRTERKEWLRATVVSAETHFLIARRSHRGPPMRVAYEDVRFAQRSERTAQLLASPLEDEPAPPEDDIPAGMEIARRIPDEDPPSAPDRQLRLITRMPADTDEPSTEPQQSLLANTINSVQHDGGKNKTDPVTASHVIKREPLRNSVGKSLEAASKNIGDNKSDARKMSKKVDLTRDHSRQLEQIHEIVGAKQVTAHTSPSPAHGCSRKHLRKNTTRIGPTRTRRFKINTSHYQPI